MPRISVLYSALAEEGATLAGFPQWALDKGQPEPMKDKEKVEELMSHKALGGGGVQECRAGNEPEKLSLHAFGFIWTDQMMDPGDVLHRRSS